MSSSALITQLLASWRKGDQQALDQLTPIVYETLRRLSSRHLNNEQHRTLQATELVHEAFLNLVGADVNWQNRAHFFAVSSRLMRRLLIDRARARLRQKRGAGMPLSDHDMDQLAEPDIEQDLLDLDDALTRLAGMEKRKSDVLELHYFGGMTYPEIAEALAISEATVDRDLRFAKAWVYNEICQQI